MPHASCSWCFLFLHGWFWVVLRGGRPVCRAAVPLPMVLTLSPRCSPRPPPGCEMSTTLQCVGYRHVSPSPQNTTNGGWDDGAAYGRIRRPVRSRNSGCDAGPAEETIRAPRSGHPVRSASRKKRKPTLQAYTTRPVERAGKRDTITKTHFGQTLQIEWVGMLLFTSVTPCHMTSMPCSSSMLPTSSAYSTFTLATLIP